MKLIVSCSKCWNDVELFPLVHEDDKFEGECPHCMVTLNGSIVK